MAAAGNDGSASIREYPAAERAYGLLAVAATTFRGTLASFSNFGNWIDVAAPGAGVTSTFPGGGYATWNGTSMAAPLATGAATLVRAADPGLAPKDVVTRLKRTGAPLCGKAAQVQIDALAAVTNGLPAPVVCR